MSQPSSLPIAIRFSTSLPDLPLTIDNPDLTSTLTLTQRIRASLPPSDPSSSLRIRLIYSGRILPLTSSLSAALRLPPPPPHGSPPHAQKQKQHPSDPKGKTPIRPSQSSSSPPSSFSLPAAPPRAKVYIHAHFSEPLAASALEAERLAALDADRSLLPSASPPPLPGPAASGPSAGPSSSSSRKSRPPRHVQSAEQSTPASPTSPSSASAAAPQQPQGFDRLLGGGLSAPEVASLRAQFVAQLAHTRTPDAMPSAAEQRALEERWLDSDAGMGGGGGVSGPDDAGTSTGAGTGGGIRGFLGLGGGQNAGGAGPAGAMTGGGAGVLGEDEEGGMLRDMLWGNVVGFFWPVGAVLWLMREEGVWSNRKRLAVMTGALVNLVFGVMRAAG